MATEAFTVRAGTELVHQPDHLTGSLGRSRNYVVRTRKSKSRAKITYRN